jgi:hypothetical protein
VVVDVKPGDVTNTVNPRSREMLAVAILTTESVDATAVDALTVRLGPAGAVPERARLSDVNADGRLDLVLQFRMEATGIACGARDVVVSGLTFDGRAISGSDSLRTVRCR